MSDDLTIYITIGTYWLAWPLALCTAIAYASNMRVFDQIGSDLNASLSRGICYVAAGFGLEDVWWGWFFLLRYVGIEVDWMLEAKPFLTPLPLVGILGYMIHMQTHDHARPGHWLTRARSCAFAATVMSSAIAALVIWG